MTQKPPSRLQRLLRHTIWAQGAIPPSEWKYRNLKRVWLPLYDVGLVYAGVLAVTRGLPALELLFPLWVTITLGWLLIILGAACFAGVAVPRLWRLEGSGKSIVLAVLVAYSVALTILADTSSPTRGFVSAITALACILPAWRLDLLGEERRERALEAALAKETPAP